MRQKNQNLQTPRLPPGKASCFLDGLQFLHPCLHRHCIVTYLEQAAAACFVCQQLLVTVQNCAEVAAFSWAVFSSAELQNLSRTLSTERWTSFLSKSLREIAQKDHGALAWLSILHVA